MFILMILFLVLYIVGVCLHVYTRRQDFPVAGIIWLLVGILGYVAFAGVAGK